MNPTRIRTALLPLLLAGLLPLAEHKVQAEAKRIAQIQQGNTSASWLTASLVAAGVLKEGETL